MSNEFLLACQHLFLSTSFCVTSILTASNLTFNYVEWPDVSGTDMHDSFCSILPVSCRKLTGSFTAGSVETPGQSVSFLEPPILPLHVSK